MVSSPSNRNETRLLGECKKLLPSALETLLSLDNFKEIVHLIEAYKTIIFRHTKSCSVLF